MINFELNPLFYMITSVDTCFYLTILLLFVIIMCAKK
jgi:hypothetical protein